MAIGLLACCEGLALRQFAVHRHRVVQRALGATSPAAAGRISGGGRPGAAGDCRALRPGVCRGDTGSQADHAPVPAAISARRAWRSERKSGLAGGAWVRDAVGGGPVLHRRRTSGGDRGGEVLVRRGGKRGAGGSWGHRPDSGCTGRVPGGLQVVTAAPPTGNRPVVERQPVALLDSGRPGALRRRDPRA